MKMPVHANQVNKTARILMSTLVFVFVFYIMIMPVSNAISGTGPNNQRSISAFIVILLMILFLPNLIYAVITMKTKKTAYVILPAIAILSADYYFFHDFPVWIASDANAAIGLLFIPVYLLLITGLSYGVAFIILLLRKNG